jgi:hypothetical protein
MVKSEISIENEYKRLYAELSIDLFLTFNTIADKELKQSIIARARGQQNKWVSQVASLMQVASSENEIDNEIIENALNIFMEDVAIAIEDYVNYFGFKPKKPDPLKINYFFIYFLYKNKLIDDLSLLRDLMTESLKEKSIIEDDLHLFNKGINVSKKGYNELQKIYGKYGFFKIYKLTYRLTKNTAT